MSFRSKADFSLMFLLMFSLSITACAPREVKPPPPTGKIVAQFSHGAEALDASYSVGQLHDRLQVVVVIVNTYLSDLDYFKLDLKVINSGEQVVFKDVTAMVDIEEHGEHTFVFSLPLLHGSHKFKFSYEYVYYDFAESGRWGRRFMRSDSDEWSYFEDLVELP